MASSGRKIGNGFLCKNIWDNLPLTYNTPVISSTSPPQRQLVDWFLVKQINLLLQVSFIFLRIKRTCRWICEQKIFPVERHWEKRALFQDLWGFFKGSLTSSLEMSVRDFTLTGQWHSAQNPLSIKNGFRRSRGTIQNLLSYICTGRPYHLLSKPEQHWERKHR